ncbi:MMPL/RND family transporter [Mycobacteroides abscessus]|uniref:MMPL/RND family transporter n=1 Tax=Mycobacteroides abscessus TaxID=36809 RepID=UPI00092A7474|nr:RND family transporter [Mycobacteroides abscessus]SHP22271.1 Putative membrane protein, MmpL family [Mycobacteroides abscessus subsp. bolletii]SHR56640.1 Putative membrane protein, MmpL family [Mycobacteroides abscessus subsp. bolletii]SHS27342.1 Putative membrane protein, MmpL family [Mycobacteroides abscessus subsp. bolletii]SKF73167.1 Putative membrane protein, MmpL family [Mycobacteroides abscessus subsp. bolletii]SKF86645.1 Putative membrane protein, MmpL family [Mycobacteroides absces
MSAHSAQKPRFARMIRKYSILVVLAWVAFTVVINVVVPQLEPVTDANQGPLVPLDAPSSKALIHIGESFQESDSNSLAMVILEGDHKLNDADHKFYDVLASKLENDKKHVQYVMNLWGQGTTAAGVQSSDGQAAYTLVRVAGDQGSTVSDESIRAVRELVGEVQPPNGVKVYVSGSAPLSTDMLQVGNQSMIRLMYVTIVIITVMLLIVYRSFTTAFLTLLIVMVELSCGRGVVAFLAYHKLIGISVFASNILVSLILGAGTDYAIFLIGRYQEARHAGEDRETAYYSAVKGVSHVILGSGLAIAGATFCLQFTRLNYFNTMGLPCAAATLVAVAASLTFGPAMLALGSRFGVFEPKVKAGHGIWRKVGTVTVRWPGRILVVSSVVVMIGSITLPTYKPNYNDRIYIADDVPANQGYAAADRHFPVSKLNSDMLMIESDHDMRNSTDMIALDKVAREVFHTPGVAMIQSVTRPLGTPLEHSSFTYTMGTMGTKINELIPFLTDLTDRFTQMADITDRMATLMRQQQELTGQQAGASHISLKGAQELKDVTVTMRDTLANFDDQFRPLRNYFYWEPHCADIPMCWAMRSLFDMTDQVDSMTDAVDDSLKAAVIQDAVTPQLVEVIGKSAAELDNMRKVVLTEQSTMRPMLTQMNELGRQMMDLGYAFDSSKNDEFFYLPPEAFDNPYFQIDLKYFVSPDGKSARYMIYHDGEALSPEGIDHAQAYLPAAKEALKGTTLAGSRVYLGGAAATYWDIQDATKTDLLIAAIAAFALIFLVMLLITRSVVAALVIVGTVAFSYSGAFGLSVLVWQHFLGIPLSWLNLPITFIILVAVGSDYNLLLISRYLEESKAGLNTGLIRAVANSGKVVTTAGIVFATTMMAMLSSDLLSVGQLGSIIGLGLLLDTLIVRSFITPAIARLLGPLFWWPRLIRSRPTPAQYR